MINQIICRSYMLKKRVDTYLCNFHGFSTYLYSLACFHQLITLPFPSHPKSYLCHYVLFIDNNMDRFYSDRQNDAYSTLYYDG